MAMKKSLILLSFILSITFLLFIPSVYATEPDQEFTYDRSIELSNPDGWKFSTYAMDPNMYIRSPRIHVTEDKLKQVQVPNFAIVNIGINVGTGDYIYDLENSPYQSVYLYFYSSENAEFPSSQKILTNQNPGALSSYKLSLEHTMDDTKRYVEIVYTLKESIYSQLVNKTYPYTMNLNSNPLNDRIKKFMRTTMDAFNHEMIDTIAFYDEYPTFKVLNKGYFVTANVEEFNPPDVEDLNTVSELPNDTDGTPGMTFNGMGSVYFSTVSGNDLIVKITYQENEWYVPFSFAPGTDMTIFDNEHLSYYYAIGGEKYILINHGNTSMFNSQNVRTQTWVDHSIWNLKTNEIVTYDRFNVYMYSKLEDAQNLYAYFYVDEFIIDRLMTVSLAWRWRYQNLIGFFGEYGEWQTSTKALEAGVAELPEDQAHWMFDWAYIGGWDDAWKPFVFGPLFTGTMTITANSAGLAQTGPISQIQKLSAPSQSLTNELTDAYKEAYPGFSAVDVADASLYRLYLGQYNAAGTVGIDIDRTFSQVGNQQGINIIQFTYVTEGELYTIEGEDIDVQFIPGPGTDGESPNFSWGFEINSATISIVSAVIVFILGILGNPGGIARLKLNAIVRILIISAVIGFIIYFVMGYIFTGVAVFNLRI